VLIWLCRSATARPSLDLRETVQNRRPQTDFNAAKPEGGKRGRFSCNLWGWVTGHLREGPVHLLSGGLKLSGDEPCPALTDKLCAAPLKNAMSYQEYRQGRAETFDRLHQGPDGSPSQGHLSDGHRHGQNRRGVAGVARSDAAQRLSGLESSRLGCAGSVALEGNDRRFGRQGKIDGVHRGRPRGKQAAVPQAVRETGGMVRQITDFSHMIVRAASTLLPTGRDDAWTRPDRGG
jgi:hypothetical protein